MTLTGNIEIVARNAQGTRPVQEIKAVPLVGDLTDGELVTAVELNDDLLDADRLEIKVTFEDGPVSRPLTASERVALADMVLGRVDGDWVVFKDRHREAGRSLTPEHLAEILQDPNVELRRAVGLIARVLAGDRHVHHAVREELVAYGRKWA